MNVPEHQSVEHRRHVKAKAMTRTENIAELKKELEKLELEEKCQKNRELMMLVFHLDRGDMMQLRDLMNIKIAETYDPDDE